MSTAAAGTTQGFGIRPFRQADAPGCARIFESVQREVFADDPPERFARERFHLDTTGELIWVAHAADRIVGFASVWPPERFIHLLLVERGWRGQGVGQALIAAVGDTLGLPIDLKCRISNLSARTFYERHGWTEVERNERDPSPYILYRLAKP
ncbi:GNAT family N-acetyltransferase [Marinivivus vitaminiproducens]|uniref:GNAT family N-acetyltransferase n=1 Tax=Marinivivus vitaminiproducens TaxID=3035935 RepID=UPI00279AAA43|nr:GNAT family N-acetyltransferase [Geminicoccaceae bacterium SCSIO 64248]